MQWTDYPLEYRNVQEPKPVGTWINGDGAFQRSVRAVLYTGLVTKLGSYGIPRAA